MAGLFTAERIDDRFGNRCLLRIRYQHVRPCIKLHDGIRSTDHVEHTECCEQQLEVAFQIVLNFNFAFKHKIGRAGEGDVFEGLVAGFFETDGQGISAFDIDLDRRFRAGE